MSILSQGKLYIPSRVRESDKGKYMPEQKKVIRDPIYGYIGVTEEQLEVIKLPVFQRLRRVSQLSFADLVYPNATHNRFSHSLGVMHLASILSNYLKTSGIGEGIGLSDDDYEAIIWAGLLHDIGHLPVSHACEPIFAFYIDGINNWKDYHVEIGTKIIQQNSFGIIDLLGEEIIKKVCKLLKGEASELHPLLVEALTGICSIDRLDYLKRDAYHAGVPEYAVIDHQRILTSLIFPEGDLYLAPIFKKKALYALEGIILSYFHMYRAIYYHHAVRSAYLLFQNIVWEAFEKYNFKEKFGDLLNPEFWNHFDDHLFLTLLRNIDEDIRTQLEGVFFRRLPKMVPPTQIKEGNIVRIYDFIGRSSFKEKVEKEKEIKDELQSFKVEKVLLDSPVVIPYPRSLFSVRAVYIWENNMERPQNLGIYAPYVLSLADAAERQLAARVYVSPSDLRFNDKFIEALNSVIRKVI